jgi:predicted MPP superfamily phosphohydrolase
VLTRRKLLIAGGGLLAGGLAYAWRIEPVWLRRYDVTVTLPRLPAAFDGYRIVQISDLHVGCGVPEDMVREAVVEANAAKPDLVVCTGDFIHRGSPAESAAQAADWLSGLSAPDGKLAVLGNHDAQVQYGHDADPVSIRRVGRALIDTGWQVLQNRAVTLERAGARARVVGLGDFWSGTFDPESVDLADAIVLEHNPDAVPLLVPARPSLILCGHTHGGQVSLPFLGPPVLPVRNRKYAAGAYDVGETQIYVNRGIGWLYRVRLFVRPEVTVLTLRTGRA